MKVPVLKQYRYALTLLAALACGILAFFSWQHFFPATAASGWTSKVFLDDFTMVSALAMDGQGNLFITHEKNRQQGSLVKRRPDGSTQEVVAGLDKPDGLVKFRGGILITQEGGDYPVLWLHDGRVDKLFDGKDIEGIDTDGSSVYVVEDVKSEGRLLRYDPETGMTTTLRHGLAEAEGVAICPDGRLFYSEKKKGWVKQYDNRAKNDPVVQAGLNAPGFLMCNAEGLWIAEDATHGARLLFVGAGGTAQVVLSHLRSAQTVLPLSPERLLVAEQGRNRILEINRVTDGKP